MSPEPKYESQKVNTQVLSRLSELSRWILANVGDGIRRDEIVEAYFGIERLYCSFYIDPCYSIRERRHRQRRCQDVQPRLSMALKRIEQRGLVQLIRHRRYVKKVLLTNEGKRVAKQLNYNGGLNNNENK